MSRSVPGGDASRTLTLHQARQIARGEMARRKWRLGPLTREQEAGVESLLMSTVTKVSEVVGRVLESWPVVPY